jgi:hypothetical protein
MEGYCCDSLVPAFTPLPEFSLLPEFSGAGAGSPRPGPSPAARASGKGADFPTSPACWAARGRAVVGSCPSPHQRPAASSKAWDADLAAATVRDGRGAEAGAAAVEARVVD